MSKRRFVITIISVVAAIAIIIVVIPFIVLSTVKTNSVDKLSKFTLHDEINNESINVIRDSYGFKGDGAVARYYIHGDLQKMEEVLQSVFVNSEIVVSGAVLYIHSGNQYYYMRKMCADSVPLQGYEYNTSNRSELINRSTAMSSSENNGNYAWQVGMAPTAAEIYLPYHMLAAAVTPSYGSSESRGTFIVGEEYALADGYKFSDIATFYSRYSVFL